MNTNFDEDKTTEAVPGLAACIKTQVDNSKRDAHALPESPDFVDKGLLAQKMLEAALGDWLINHAPEDVKRVALSIMAIEAGFRIGHNGRGWGKFEDASKAAADLIDALAAKE